VGSRGKRGRGAKKKGERRRESRGAKTRSLERRRAKKKKRKKKKRDRKTATRKVSWKFLVVVFFFSRFVVGFERGSDRASLLLAPEGLCFPPEQFPLLSTLNT
jgi:hypothetical protein